MTDLALGSLAGQSLSAALLPRCGISFGTQVLTLAGALAIENVAVGDKLITRAGACRVMAVETATLQDVPMIHIRGGVLGKHRPESDVFLPPDQQILIRDWRAKAMTGQDKAMMAARRLADGEYIRLEQMAEVRLVTVRFAAPQVIFAAGLEVLCELG